MKADLTIGITLSWYLKCDLALALWLCQKYTSAACHPHQITFVYIYFSSYILRIWKLLILLQGNPINLWPVLGHVYAQNKRLVRKVNDMLEVMLLHLGTLRHFKQKKIICVQANARSGMILSDYKWEVCSCMYSDTTCKLSWAVWLGTALSYNVATAYSVY